MVAKRGSHSTLHEGRDEKPQQRPCPTAPLASQITTPGLLCASHTHTVSLSGTLYTLNVRAIYTCHHLLYMYQCSMKTPSWDVAHIYRFAVLTLSWRISLYVAGGRSAGGLAGGSRACGAHALPAGMQRAEHDLSKICHTVAVILLPPHC